MAQTQAIVATLKRALKSHGLTYADVARGLGMSEANVKRLFASERFTLARIEEVCRLMEMDLSELFQLYEASRSRIAQLTEDQERELVADPLLLMVAVFVQNHLGFADITGRYNISVPDCIRCLAKLDRLRIIDLLPNNRIKLRIDERFSWLPGGPIERFFEREVQQQFLCGSFRRSGGTRLFFNGLLSEHSRQLIARRLEALGHEIADLQRQDAGRPPHERHNTGILLALREWEFDASQPFLKPR
ncbi:transcriptional regulator [Marinobacterium nitratireducens]|uniref:Transcriptional regulator n=1 Tax=Marinobacterium nitratireducens TaxID=518897 RepID=A0A917ZRH5_9GAMM|nr:helix-turn-helix transcriptional regulator [Marinobacterium nitratireducens]GGO88696.1 transcriptional regulator [Marinobacterium nitratireducens]